MGQKVNPHGLRVGVIKDWDSKWYAEKDFADYLVEDYKIREYLKKNNIKDYHSFLVDSCKCGYKYAQYDLAMLYYEKKYETDYYYSSVENLLYTAANQDHGDAAYMYGLISWNHYYKSDAMKYWVKAVELGNTKPLININLVNKLLEEAEKRKEEICNNPDIMTLSK